MLFRHVYCFTGCSFTYGGKLLNIYLKHICKGLLFSMGPALISTASLAATIIVTPASMTWSNPAGENGGGGSSAITGTKPDAGNGSVEIFGDRTRFIFGNQFSAATNFGLVNTVRALTFDWAIAGNSTALLNPDYTPALRLYVQDGRQRSELIWEGAYNNTYGHTVKDQFYSTGVGDNFYQFKTGFGVTTTGGSQVNQSITDWAKSFGEGAFVSAISVGAGSSAGSLYHAFADNVTLDISGNSTTYNFETSARAVPEPTTIALLGLGLLGFAASRRKSTK